MTESEITGAPTKRRSADAPEDHYQNLLPAPEAIANAAIAATAEHA
jgi:hypothetical protein